MEVLAVFDEKNYDDTTKVYEKYNVRGVIFRDGKIAMQCSTDGEYKMPGGGRRCCPYRGEPLRKEIFQHKNRQRRGKEEKAALPVYENS